ncbi:MAG: energy transducer TonB family protein [Brevinemataceae bacterium]
MLKEKRIFTFYYESRQRVKHLVLIIWISLTIHIYGILVVNKVSNIWWNGQSEERRRPEKEIYKVILDTKTESKIEPEKAAISDKNNINQAEKVDKTKEEDYNFVNLSPADHQGQGGKTSYIPQQKSEKRQQEQVEKNVRNGKTSAVKEKTKLLQEQASEGGGETAPTLYNTDKKKIINLYNRGSASVATQSKEYAQYFISMQKKIEKYHREFFPVYQYYQGLLKDGQVVVEFSVNTSGDIVKAEIISSYGSETVDQASLNSVVFAKNFGPLPNDLAEQGEIHIRFHFVYVGR